MGTKKEVTIEVEFTDRDVKLLELLANGKKDAEIAAQIDMSMGSIRNVLRLLCNMTGAKNRSNLVAWAIRQKIIK